MNQDNDRRAREIAEGAFLGRKGNIISLISEALSAAEARGREGALAAAIENIYALALSSAAAVRNYRQACEDCAGVVRILLPIPPPPSEETKG